MRSFSGKLRRRKQLGCTRKVGTNVSSPTSRGSSPLSARKWMKNFSLTKSMFQRSNRTFLPDPGTCTDWETLTCLHSYESEIEDHRNHPSIGATCSSAAAVLQQINHDFTVGPRRCKGLDIQPWRIDRVGVKYIPSEKHGDYCERSVGSRSLWRKLGNMAKICATCCLTMRKPFW